METFNILRKNELFKDLEDEGIQAIADLTTIKKLQKGSRIFSQGDESHSMYVIKQGKVKISVDDGDKDGGKEGLVLTTLQQGDNFGELSLLDDHPRSANADSVEDCVLIVLHKTDFHSLVLKHPKIAIGVMRFLCGKIRFLTDMARDMALLDVYKRIIKLLNDMSTPNEHGVAVVSEPLTQTDIAAHVGCGRERVSQIMNGLKRGKYISIQKQIITIHQKLPSAW